ncbi:MAG TPA: helix-turn-helix transcriptional regulator [Povalibacter sp.]|nr:helix-turn-helix transcriptional regulator [Povalibacter sp.]
MRFQARLHAAFLQRRRINPGYSLRAFARALRIDHATLSQILRGRRRVTARTIRACGLALGLTPREIRDCCHVEHEAAIVLATTHPHFRPDSRWLAVTLNIPLDDVNIALQALLQQRRLSMKTRNSWQVDK